ncbi:hypothetical protein SCLCIDRAFT_1214752, partial [Scleroderma citrinum Foug A]
MIDYAVAMKEREGRPTSGTGERKREAAASQPQRDQRLRSATPVVPPYITDQNTSVTTQLVAQNKYYRYDHLIVQIIINIDTGEQRSEVVVRGI